MLETICSTKSMEQQLNKKFKLKWLILMFATVILLAFTADTALATNTANINKSNLNADNGSETVQMSIPLLKVVKAEDGFSKPSDMNLVDKFTYTVTPITEGSPEANPTSVTGPGADEGSFFLNGITFTESDIGDHQYRITESYTNESDEAFKKMYSLDSDKIINVNVSKAEDDTLKVSITDDAGDPIHVDRQVVFTNTYKPLPVALDIHVSKTLQNKELTKNMFKFALKAAPNSENAPMPSESSLSEDNAVYASNDAHGNVSFGQIEFTKPGTYSYEVVEIADNTQPYIFDTSIKTFDVVVVDNGDGTISADLVTDDEGDLTFTNTYQPKPAVIALKAHKKLVGRDLKSEEFNFEVKDDTGKVVASGVNDENGSIKFSTFSIKEPGEYTYTMNEIAGNDSAITYDTNKKAVTLVVEDVDGQLQVQGNIDEPVFNNKYTSNKITANSKTPKNVQSMPKTSDILPIGLLVVLVIAGVVAIVVGVKKTKK